MNPMPEMAAHELAIDEGVAVADVDAVLETAAFYRLTDGDAQRIVDDVRGALTSWRSVAKSGALGTAELETLEAAILA